MGVVIMLSALPREVLAQPPVSSLPTSLGTCQLAHVSGSIACAGAFDKVNDANSSGAMASYFSTNFGSYGPWSPLGTTDAGASTGPFSSVPGSTSGTLVFDNLLYGYLGIVLKGADQIAIYVVDAGSTGLNSVSFSTAALKNNGGQTPNLSHASLWQGGGDVPVPEPSSLALVATALLGIGFCARRREQG
jgi:hypothetical protein